MDCLEGFGPCANKDKKCDMCIDGSQFKEYVAKQVKGLQKRNYNKKSNRMGSTFEYNNHKNNKAAIDSIVNTSMTPNSGAGSSIKGDEQITGLIRIMEELKTQEVERARGHSQFTIKREWLDKLDREAPPENMEFWYLKFAFKDTDDKSYVVIDTQQIMDMVTTIVHDRKLANEADSKVEVVNKRLEYVNAEMSHILAEEHMKDKKIEYYEALLNQHNIDY